MLTTDPIYKKALLPVITIKNTANSSTLYSYSSFAGTATGITTAFPLYCSVSLSQNTHGEFSIQFHDPNEAMENTVTVGSRVQIDCGKQSGSTTRLISGLVRKKGYSRGGDHKLLYTISGSSTGIRLNELVTYQKSEAAKLADGITLDTTDATRKADTLLASVLAPLTNDGVLSIANLAANSDVETFIANLAIEYGEMQDAINYIEDQSGGETIVDTTDLVNFRYEIKNTLQGRGFTLKNSRANEANDDADDTMYLRAKNWSYEDDFFKSSAYANRLYAILQPENRPGNRIDLGFISILNLDYSEAGRQLAFKFKPTHTRHFASDFMFVGVLYQASIANLPPSDQQVIICKDVAGSPGGTVALVTFNAEQFRDPVPLLPLQDNDYQIHVGDAIVNIADSTIGQTYLDTTQNYWFIIDLAAGQSGTRLLIGRNQLATGSNYKINTGPSFAGPGGGGTSWGALTANTGAIAVGRYRSHSLVMWDPKAVQAVSSGLTAGQYVDTVLTDLGSSVTTFESMYRHLANQMYITPKPRTVYNFPAVLAPNIPPFPGDPIVISDTILGLSTSGNQVMLTTCGDMTYQWGSMDRGDYQAPTILNINAIGVHPKYR